jgi:hypothetical protein
MTFSFGLLTLPGKGLMKQAANRSGVLSDRMCQEITKLRRKTRGTTCDSIQIPKFVSAVVCANAHQYNDRES